MPIDALRSVSEQFDVVLRDLHPRRLALDMGKADKAFHFRNFKGVRMEKIGRGLLKKIAKREIFSGKGHELFANLIIIHWNNANNALYQEMVSHVQSINEDVEAIERIEDDKAHAIIEDLSQRHDLDHILLCVRLNGVRFGDALVESRLIRGEAAPEGMASTEESAEAADPAPPKAEDGPEKSEVDSAETTAPE
ncbi:MAG: hypothetical protein ACI9MR_002242 [Myxococcota bacterium]|jgi:hypothetical protein